MNFWVMSDTHLGHDAIRDYCGRPNDHEMRILNGLWRVQPEDVLIHLGDVCMYDDDRWHRLIDQSCLGKRWLVRGNHDRKSLTWYLSRGWNCVSDELKIRMFGKDVLFTHAPATNHSDFDINIHGHLHNTGHREAPATTNRICIYMEHHYAPQSLRYIIDNFRVCSEPA